MNAPASSLVPSCSVNLGLGPASLVLCDVSTLYFGPKIFRIGSSTTSPATIGPGQRIEVQTVWSTDKFVRTARRYRTAQALIKIRASGVH
jgi:hypothetical protein